MTHADDVKVTNFLIYTTSTVNVAYSTNHCYECEIYRQENPMSSLLFFFCTFVVNLEKFKSQLSQLCDSVKK